MLLDPGVGGGGHNKRTCSDSQSQTCRGSIRVLCTWLPFPLQLRHSDLIVTHVSLFYLIRGYYEEIEQHKGEQGYCNCQYSVK